MIKLSTPNNKLATNPLTISDINTEQGNTILESLLEDQGWHIHSQYNQYAFDKGIDFDSYTIRKNYQELYFEWTNWLEWEISGDADVINRLCKEYGLNTGA